MLMPEMVTQIFAIAAIFIVQAKSNENTQVGFICFKLIRKQYPNNLTILS